MFERFTAPARRVVIVAQEEARRLGHDVIEAEHLLLALLADDDGGAIRVLVASGVEPEPTRAEIESRFGRGAATTVEAHIPFTDRAKRALELSLREALQLGHRHIGTEHVLLGLLRDGRGVGAEVLVDRGLELTEVRARVLDDLVEHPIEPPSEPEVPLSVELAGRPVRTVATTAFAPGPSAEPGRVTPGLLAVVFVLVGAIGAVVERPPTTLARFGLGLLLVGLVAALVSAVVQHAPGPWARRRGRLPRVGFTAAMLAFGVASGLLVLDALLA